MATTPPFSPNASLHQAYTPPPLSAIIVASSAPARDNGMRNRTVPIIYHPTHSHPYIAIEGKFLILSTAATLIIARAKIPSSFLGAGLVLAGDVESSLTFSPLLYTKHHVFTFYVFNS